MQKAANVNILDPQSTKQRGFGLIEVLVSLFLLGLISLGITQSLTTSLAVAKLTEVHFAASSLASSHMEELAAIDFASLNSGYNETGTIVTTPGLNMTFSRDTTITINPDNSRTVTVTVTSNHDGLPTRVNFTSTFALWE